MPKTFLYANVPSEDEAMSAASDSQGSSVNHRDKVSILVIGPPLAVNRVISEMSHVGFSDSVEWSKSIPTDRQKESMRVLTRYVFADAQND